MRYLIVKYFKTPKGQWNEQSITDKRLRVSDLTTAAVILDYKTRTVTKAVIDGQTMPKDFDKLNNYYKELFPQAVENLEKAWIPQT